MSGFHFCPGTIFQNCLGSRDTPRDITFQKKFFSKILKTYTLKILKTYAFLKKRVIPENKTGFELFQVKVSMDSGVISVKKAFRVYPSKGSTNELARNTLLIRFQA